eukprot:6407513-Karenia_brevis.AAC.1
MGMISRSGIGKMRHLDVNELWLQEALRQKKFTILKVSGTRNTADAMTKHVTAETLDRHMKELKVTFIGPELPQ